MGISEITNNNYRNYMPGISRQTNQADKSDFATEPTGKTNKLVLQKDALFSMCHVPTGESASVYRAEEYSEENPVYLVKGTDKNGEYYEEKIDVSKVDPNHCSYTELLALNVHTGNNSSSVFLSMSILRDKAQGASIQEKIDYAALIQERMDELKNVGYWEDYLRYDKWLNDILDFCNKTVR